MRDRQRLELKPDEYRDVKALERQQTLRELLGILRRAAATGAEWYYGALETADRTRRRTAAQVQVQEPEPEPDPDSPFQAPAPRGETPEQARLFT